MSVIPMKTVASMKHLFARLTGTGECEWYVTAEHNCVCDVDVAILMEAGVKGSLRRSRGEGFSYGALCRSTTGADPSLLVYAADRTILE